MQPTEYVKGHFGRLYTFDRRLFSVVETEADAYWLGFFAADGFVKSRGTFGFHLGIPDLEHLRRFAEYAGTNQPIIIKEKWCRLEIADKSHLQVLEKWGFVQGKSSSLSMPALPEGLRRHFIRGVFDGDGCVTGKPGRLRKPYVAIVGNVDLLTSMRSEFSQAFNAPNNKLICRKTDKDWFARLSYGGMDTTEQMYHYFYDDATVYLERKFIKWQSLRRV